MYPILSKGRNFFLAVVTIFWHYASLAQLFSEAHKILYTSTLVALNKFVFLNP